MDASVIFAWLGAGLCLAFGVLFLLEGVNAARAAKQSASWRQMPARVLSSAVKEQKSNNSDGEVSYSYLPEVRYAYEVAGEIYQCDRIRFGIATCSTQAQAQKLLRRYPVEETVTAWVDPSDPAKATLDTTPGGLGVYFVFGTGFTALGLFLAGLPLFYG